MGRSRYIIATVSRFRYRHSSKIFASDEFQPSRRATARTCRYAFRLKYAYRTRARARLCGFFPLLSLVSCPSFNIVTTDRARNEYCAIFSSFFFFSQFITKIDCDKNRAPPRGVRDVVNAPGRPCRRAIGSEYWQFALRYWLVCI